ncbi:hypothetical protein BKA93DRAFT_748752 [Sparassis latifolia]
MPSSIDTLIDVQSQLRYSRAVYVGEYASSSAPIRPLECCYFREWQLAPLQTGRHSAAMVVCYPDLRSIVSPWPLSYKLARDSYFCLLPGFLTASSFGTSYSEVSHRKATEGVYKCDNCHKTFGHRDDIRRHKLAVHDKIKNFFCEAEGCQKGFLLPDALKMHGKTHSNERPHYCPLYGKDYKSEQTWKRHIREVHQHDGSQFMCTLCSTRYQCQRQFVEHLKKHDMMLEKSILNQTVSHHHRSGSAGGQT